jgi:acetyl esterase/lipase
LEAGSAGKTVEAAAKPGEPWQARPVRTVDDLPPAVRSQTDAAPGRYGGKPGQQLPSTGFFYTTNLSGRWWFVDPEGLLFLQAGVSSVKTIPTSGAKAALAKQFGNESGWAAQTTKLLRDNGFNGLGAWSDTDRLRAVPSPLPYTRLWNFMSSYGRKRGGTFQQPGHTGYPKDCLFVFDPAFEAFCDEHARQIAASRDDPWLLGHFSDNELPFKREALRNYLSLQESDPGYRAAAAWLTDRHGSATALAKVTPEDEQDFLALVVKRYFGIVSRAIRKYDPNHLFLGARFYGSDLRFPEVFRAAGPYLDVVSVNWYRAWTPQREKLDMWTWESGKPVLITEWYAKGADSGLANTGGAGWLVKTQRDRGLFYEHFTLALLEAPSCVGWHWFRYSDNDPGDKTVDPSNRDSNKGIVSSRYAPYLPLLASMKQVNSRLYALADYFAAHPAPTAYANPRFTNVTVTPGVEFARVTNFYGAGEPLSLDIYQPVDDPSQSRPAILWLHGGGLRTGTSRAQGYIAKYARRFAQRGFVGFSADYRVRRPADMPNRAAELPALKDAAQDARAALGWIREHAADYRVNPRWLFVVGGSAGGMVGCCVCYSTVTNSTPLPPDGPFNRQGIIAFGNLWGSPEPPKRWYLQEGRQIDGRATPTCIIHGTEDVTVPFQNSLDLSNTLAAAGVRVELHALEGLGHTPTSAATDPQIETWLAEFFVSEWAKSTAR